EKKTPLETLQRGPAPERSLDSVAPLRGNDTPPSGAKSRDWPSRVALPAPVFLSQFLNFSISQFPRTSAGSAAWPPPSPRRATARRPTARGWRYGWCRCSVPPAARRPSARLYKIDRYTREPAGESPPSPA